MAKLLGPDFISLQVLDLAAARTFYSELLGFNIDPEFDTPDFVLLETNSIPLGLRAADISAVEQPESSEKLLPGAGISIWLDCDSVDELWTRLAAANVPIKKLPFDGPFGRTFSFVDPDGYIITANHNPWDRFPLGGKPKVKV